MNKVIALKNLPTKLPIQFTMLVYLLLEHFNGRPAWVGGAVWTFVVLVWGGCIYNICKQNSVDIFDKK